MLASAVSRYRGDFGVSFPVERGVGLRAGRLLMPNLARALVAVFVQRCGPQRNSVKRSRRSCSRSLFLSRSGFLFSIGFLFAIASFLPVGFPAPDPGVLSC